MILLRSPFFCEFFYGIKGAIPVGLAVEYFNITKRIGCVHHRFDRLFVFVVFAGDRRQIAVFDNERCERVVVKEKGIAVLERVFGSFCEEFSSDLERREVF